MVFTDMDRWDENPSTVHVVAARGAQMAGAVRLYPLDDEGRWKGDRLAVLPDHRASLVGARLVRFAVATAAAAGGIRMEASVQAPNARFFERLGWCRDGDIGSYHGLPHQPMAIDLLGVPAMADERPGSIELRLPVAQSAPSPLLAVS